MALRILIILAALPLMANAANEQAVSEARANPIRKVVTMLQTLQKKVTAEGEKEKELYEKFECYCKNSGSQLGGSIAAAETKAPAVESSIKEGESQKAQLDEDLKAHKTDRDAAKAAVADATAIREKEAAAYAEEKGSYGGDIEAIQKAVAALEKGMTGGFLQTSSAQVLRSLVQSKDDMMESDKQTVMSFLSGAQSTGYSPASGEVVGILKQMLDEMAKGLSEATAAEEASIKAFEELTAAKEKEIAALTQQIEEKSVRVGEVAVQVVELKNDLASTQQGLEGDKAFLADLEANCGTKKSEWEEHQKIRSQELLALSETIQLLNSDDALDLFKKAVPSAGSSFVQVGKTDTSLRLSALAALRRAQHAAAKANPSLDFIALALQGKKFGFEKVLKMIDEMVANLKTEQQDDDHKKEYCGTQFDLADDKKKGLERSVSDSEVSIKDTEEGIATLQEELKALEAGIAELDKSVAEATEQRKEEHEAYTELMSLDSQAKELLGVAKNRLNKFYNPALHVPPPKKELTQEERIYTSVAGEAFVQISVHEQHADAPPPPPETFGAYSTKSEGTTGVIAMIDMIIKDLDKEMTTAETDEKNAQKEYESMMSDSKQKRALDSKAVTEKEAAKADLESEAMAHKEAKDSATRELSATLEYIQSLHSECDWLLQYFDVRKEA
eukprot:CAMPEP_0170613858 /NCGR_PEP_ID=MMETSP0224-20130122/24493_1 /TAXON_ID=285029 /ORGANISM="Togula jolla, Strain CCCM 725" /LENGTH=672 /DNA_ID=CAMNT_0010939481 /DNA_START=56 /DNA_END=2070 /DNA_ORIENTATION=-